MIDYDKTIEKFFEEVSSYLTRRMTQAKDTIELQKIKQTKSEWGIICTAPKKYINERFDYMNILSGDGFLRGDNNTVLLAVNDVLAKLSDIYVHRQQGLQYMVTMDMEAFLNAYKRWKYVSSSSMFKDFTFPLRSAKSFAVKVEQNQK